MSTSPSRQQVLHLYRHILKQANQFTNLNFRNHAQRRIAYAFRQKKNLTDPTLVNDEFQQGLQAFNLVRRQAIISSLYPSEASAVANSLHR
eukprot:gene6649-7351_t